MARVLQGHCAGCGVGIPVGHIVMVTKYEVLDWAGTGQRLKTQRPVEIYCRICPQSKELVGMGHTRRNVRSVPLSTEGMSVKDIATRLFKVISGKPRGSRRLATKAGVEYSDVIPMILRKLAEAGKIEKVKTDEGGVRWRKA